MVIQLSPKHPFEEYFVEFDFSDADVLGDQTIGTVDSVTVTDQNGTVVTSTITDAGAQTNTDTSVNVWVQSGTYGNYYTITCKITAATTLQEYVIVAVLPVIAHVDGYFSEKQSGEEYYIEFDFTDHLIDGEVISTVDDVSAVNSSGTDATSDVSTPASQTNNDSSVFVWAKGGDSDNYTFSVQVTTDSGNKYQIDGVLPVA